MKTLHAWEEEVLFPHRWGRHGNDGAIDELTHLRGLHELISASDVPPEELLNQIISLEICNWRLEESITELCHGIGKNTPSPTGIGHMGSMTPDRWMRAWAYYLAVRRWLSLGSLVGANPGRQGFDMPLSLCDPDGSTTRHVESMLGAHTEIKDLYAERFCLCMELWVRGFPGADSPQMVSHQPGVEAIEARIRALNPDANAILRAMDEEGGRLEICHHKLFRRYDIILSSIGTGSWRGGIPEIGTTGFERASAVELALRPVISWIAGKAPANDDDKLIHEALGGRTPGRIFTASLMVSLLQSGAESARNRAQSRLQQIEKP